MGWFWGSSNDGKKPDPVKNLDPDLRDFLKKETPTTYESSAPPPQHPSPKETRSALPEEAPSKPKVPPQSLFQDGRYADIWESYKPQQVIEAEHKSDREKISDVVDAFKYRKWGIGQAALENCALEQQDINDCFKYGGWEARFTMCKTEQRKLDRCYLMQAKFLKALGYLSLFDRPAEIDEEIQMHADTLYQRMIKQENEIALAKKEGRPAPVFAPLAVSLNRSDGVERPPSVIETELKAETQAKLEKRYEGLTPEEAEVEKQAFDAEVQAGLQMASIYMKVLAAQDEERNKKKVESKETSLDKVKDLLRFRQEVTQSKIDKLEKEVTGRSTTRAKDTTEAEKTSDSGKDS